MQDSQKKILEKLFSNFSKEREYEILDAGSGSTSLSFLTSSFQNSNIIAVIYPGDEKKMAEVKEVSGSNFNIKEVDLREFEQEKDFDIVLSHLFLGESTKFRKERFEEMVETLFGIRSEYVAIIDTINDPDVDYRYLLRIFSKKGDVQRVIREEEYIAFLLRKQ